MGTKNDPGDFDCYEKAEPNEPRFALLGRDRHAGVVIRLWALRRHREDEDITVINEALRCAEQADDWARARGRTLDGPASARAEALYMAATTGMDEHPEAYEFPCNCDLCRSYGTE